MSERNPNTRSPDHQVPPGHEITGSLNDQCSTSLWGLTVLSTLRSRPQTSLLVAVLRYGGKGELAAPTAVQGHSGPSSQHQQSQKCACTRASSESEMCLYPFLHPLSDRRVWSRFLLLSPCPRSRWHIILAWDGFSSEVKQSSDCRQHTPGGRCQGSEAQFPGTSPPWQLRWTLGGLCHGVVDQLGPLPGDGTSDGSTDGEMLFDDLGFTGKWAGSGGELGL